VGAAVPLNSLQLINDLLQSHDSGASDNQIAILYLSLRRCARQGRSPLAENVGGALSVQRRDLQLPILDLNGGLTTPRQRPVEGKPARPCTGRPRSSAPSNIVLATTIGKGEPGMIKEANSDGNMGLRNEAITPLVSPRLPSKPRCRGSLADFIKNTLLGIEIGDDYLADLLEE
jgi:hypothetical protein